MPEPYILHYTNGLEIEVGDAALTESLQHLDPLRGTVPLDQRMDLGQDTKHNGQVSFVPMPDDWPEIKNFPHYREAYAVYLEHKWPNYTEGSDIDLIRLRMAEFYRVLPDWDIWTLLYSEDVWENVQILIGLLREHNLLNVLKGVSYELLPARENPYLGRAHGQAATYVSGCRGPLCTLANRLAQRKRYSPDYEFESDEAEFIELALTSITSSYQAYIKYAKFIRDFRRSIRINGLKVPAYANLGLVETILIDCTDESADIFSKPHSAAIQ